MSAYSARQSTLNDGNIISAALFNNEFNAILNAFAYASTGTTGHRHDGTAGEGGNIHTIGDQDFLNKLVIESNEIKFFIEVGGAAVEQLNLVDGVLAPETTNDIDLGTSSKRFKTIYGTTLDVSTSIANSQLANSTVSYGGISLALGASDATPAFNLADATGYLTSNLSGTVATAQIADDAVTNAKIGVGAVGTTELATSAVTTTKLNTGVVTTAKIADDAVTNAKVADDAIDTAQLADSAVDSARLASNAVTTAKITDANVTTAKIADAAVTGAKIGTNTITAGNMGTGSINSDAFQDNTIATSRIIDDAITNAKLANDSVSLGGITVALGASDATPAFDLSDATSYPTSSLSGTITNAQLAGSIANAKLSNSSVSFGGVSLALGASDATPAFNLADATGYLTSNLSGTIATAQIADDAVTDAKLADAINTAITANTAKVTNATHTGEVTGATALTIADNVVDEANLKVSNAPVNGYFLSAQSGDTGGLTWAAVSGGIASLVADTSPQLGGNLDINSNSVTGTGTFFNVTDTNNNILANNSASDATLTMKGHSNSSGTPWTNIIFARADGVSKGSITTNAYATQYNTSSDYRLKEDVQAVPNATARTLALKPCNFQWIGSSERTDGFLAHELAEQVPDAVTGEKDAVDTDGNPEYQGIDQAKLVPLLVKTIQELEARIAALESA